MKLSLRARLTLLGIGPLVCVGVLAATALVVLTNLEIGRQTEQDAREMSASLTSFVAAKEHHLQLETNLLAEVPYLKSVALMDFKDTKLRSEVYDTVKSNLDHYSHFLDTDGLLLVNDDGKVWVSSGILTGLEGKPLPSFGVDRALNEKVAWSGIVEFDNKLILAATAPLVVGSLSKGALVCYVQVGASTASELGRSLGTQVAFITRNGTMANSMGLDWISIPKTGLARITIKGQEYVGRPVSLAGTGEDNVHVVALRNLSDIVGQAKGAFVIVILILGAAMLVASVMAGRFSARLTKPIDTLVTAVRSLETGEWPDEIPASGNDEISELQRAFNRMVHSLQDQQRKLVEMLDKDPLTELMNHRKFKEVADQLLAKAEERKQPASMLLFDVDGFAEYNRQYGLLAGEEVLQKIARRLLDRAPGGAVVSRYGGDSFAILMDGVSMQEASELGAEMLSVPGFDRAKGGLTMSGGCAELTPSTDRAESLSLAAELALSKAKQLGRHRICNFDSLVEGAQSDPFQLSQFVQNATLSTIQALAAAVDAKDPYTQGHSQRVAEYASELCRRIGGSDEEIELVYRTGTLHDVGKIGIPDQILKKQGPLEPQERALMETHPALGELIVQKVPHLQDTLPGVRNHHERWDGKGYPDGLSKEAIPRLGRILAVADTFDAMTSDRPYRNGMAVETAIAEIRRNAGLQFDPEMALAFVRMIAETQVKPAA